MMSVNDPSTFLEVFAPAKDFYGVTAVGEMKDGKAQSTSTCLHEPLMQSTIEKHLAGQISIGVSPLKGDDTIEFGAIDIDNYDGDLLAIVNAIYEYELPICPCYSKSKKLHLYFFFTPGTTAENGVEIMRWYARAFGLSSKVEIFPKQLKRTANNKAYSWINLPYFAESSDNHRKMVGKNGQLLSIGQFLDRAKRSKVEIEQHRLWISQIPFHDAPPCILTSILLNDIGEGGRNNFLFSVGTYLKFKSEEDDSEIDLEDELLRVNNRLDSPLEERELKQTVLSSLEKKSYFYICSAMSHCDKNRCMKLEYGVGSSKSTGLSYGTFTQYKTDPPYYTWEVNGQLMTFYSESEVLGQSKFREMCMRELHILPRKVDDNRWTATVNKALANVEVVIPDSKMGDFTLGSMFYAVICEFFQDRRRAQSIGQLKLGRVFYDEEKRAFAFLTSEFLKFAIEVKAFKGMSAMQMRQKLIEYGAYPIGSTWYMPLDALEEIDDPNEVKHDDIELDLSTHEGESDDF